MKNSVREIIMWDLYNINIWFWFGWKLHLDNCQSFNVFLLTGTKLDYLTPIWTEKYIVFQKYTRLTYYITVGHIYIAFDNYLILNLPVRLLLHWFTNIHPPVGVLSSIRPENSIMILKYMLPDYTIILYTSFIILNQPCTQFLIEYMK